MLGPLHPNEVELPCSEPGLSTFTSSLSAYAQIRNEKILRRNGMDINIPRYLLLSVEHPSNSLLSSIHAAYDKLQMKFVQNSNQSAKEHKISSDVIVGQTSECATGSCFIRPRSGLYFFQYITCIFTKKYSIYTFFYFLQRFLLMVWKETKF